LYVEKQQTVFNVHMFNDHVIIINISKKADQKSDLIHGQFNTMNTSNTEDKDIFLMFALFIRWNRKRKVEWSAYEIESLIFFFFA